MNSRLSLGNRCHLQGLITPNTPESLKTNLPASCNNLQRSFSTVSKLQRLYHVRSSLGALNIESRSIPQSEAETAKALKPRHDEPGIPKYVPPGVQALEYDARKDFVRRRAEDTLKQIVKEKLLPSEPIKKNSKPPSKKPVLRAKLKAQREAKPKESLGDVHLGLNESKQDLEPWRDIYSGQPNAGTKTPEEPRGRKDAEFLAVDLDLNIRSIELMEETLKAARSAGLLEDVRPAEPAKDPQEKSPPPIRRERKLASLAWVLRHKYHDYITKDSLRQRREARASLPVSQHADSILDMIRSSIWCLIVGATGSGKTTQIPQIILDDAMKSGKGATCNIVCLQPRRIAASSVAERVTYERGLNLRDQVGYHVRFDNQTPSGEGGNITYCTTGILLQQLQHGHRGVDVLDNVSHLVLDEVHERPVDLDLLFVLLKRIIPRRMKEGKNVPKVIFMSATADALLLKSYFANADGISADESNLPVLHIPGRTFPVTKHFLGEILGNLEQQTGLNYRKGDKKYIQSENALATEVKSLETDSNAPDKDPNELETFVPIRLIAFTLVHVCSTTQGGTILVFLPGAAHLRELQSLLFSVSRGMSEVDFTDRSKYNIILLHRGRKEAQREAFDPVPPGVRKIIIATNIAETSITVPDIEYVVDSGKVKEEDFDQVRSIGALDCTWVSQSSANQRAGRAGRVQKGHYYGVYSKDRYEKLNQTAPAVLSRTDLQRICLDIKALKVEGSIGQFLSETIEPPPTEAVEKTVSRLKAFRALTEDEQLTPLGKALAGISLHRPLMGRIVLLGVIFHCLDPMLILARLGQDFDTGIFITSPGPLEESTTQPFNQLFFAHSSRSDHIAVLNAYKEIQERMEEEGPDSARIFCDERMINYQAFLDYAEGISLLRDRFRNGGLLPAESLFDAYGFNENSHNVELIKALLIVGLQSNIAIRPLGKMRKVKTEKGEEMKQGLPNQRYTTPHAGKATVSSTSVNRVKKGQKAGQLRRLVLYGDITEHQGRPILRETTEISPFLALIFGGTAEPLTVHEHDGEEYLRMDNWLHFKLPRSPDRQKHYQTLIRFQQAFQRLMMRAFEDVGSDQYLVDDPVRQKFRSAIVRLVDLERDIEMLSASQDAEVERDIENELGLDWKSLGKAEETLTFSPPKNSRSSPWGSA